MSSKINLQTCEYACKSSIFQDNQLISNIKMEGDLSFIGLEFQGGKIDNFNFYGNQIMQNNFLDLQIKDMNLNCAFIENRMERIDFKGTKISGYCRDNIFIECEPNGIMP